jgi:hypothetical protein
MKTLCLTLLTLLCLSFSQASLALLPELPFCPAGGPPGWYNRFIQQHDNNRWRNNYAYSSPQYYQPAYYQARPYYPAYPGPYTQQPPVENNRYYQYKR